MLKIRNIAVMMILAAGICCGENIDPYNLKMKYAWSENVGWINFDPGWRSGAQVSSSELTGYVWSENVGWINLSPRYIGKNLSGYNIGVVNDGNGNLSGLAWGENVGWINFDPRYPGEGRRPNPFAHVRINSDGKFSGLAWGENIGWINFSLGNYSVQACKVCMEDIEVFASEWLEHGKGWTSDVNNDMEVNLEDFAVLAANWLDYCPGGWEMK